MSALATDGYSRIEGFTRCHPKCRVKFLVVDLVSPDAEIAVEISQGPHGQALGINRFGHQSDVLGDLCIPSKIKDKLGICCPKQPLANRSISGLCPGSCGLCTTVVSQERLEVRAPKIGTTIHDEVLGKSPMSPHTLAQAHEARALRRE